MSKCPVCGKEYTAPPAISHKDNKTEICPLCGMREALDAAPLTEEQKAESEEIVSSVLFRNVNEKNGKRAVTHFRVLKRFNGYTFIESLH